MNDEIDPIEWLRQRDPLRALPPDDFDAQRTLDRIRSRVLVERRRRRHRRLVAVALGVSVASAAAGVAAVVLTRTSTHPTHVVCYSAVDLDASRSVVALDDDPVGTCRSAWSDPVHSEVFTTPIPRLAACTLPSGAVAVFPADGGDPCVALGLTAGASPGPDDSAVRSVEQQLTEYVDGACLSVDELTTLADAELAIHNLDDWTAVPVTEATSDSCGSIAVDGESRTIWIIPLPPMPPPAPPTTTQ